MKKWIFLGDSLTDCRRLWLPEHSGLGNGYVWNIKEKLEKTGQAPLIINKGHDGFTLPFLGRCLERDCLRQKPDLVSILIGINDVAVAMHTGKSLEEQDFAAGYDRLIRRLLEGGVKTICCMSPFLFPHPQEYENWMEEVRRVESIIDVTARRYRLPFLPLQKKMNQSARDYGFEAVTVDGIHLTAFAHGLLADWWLESFLKPESLVSHQ